MLSRYVGPAMTGLGVGGLAQRVVAAVGVSRYAGHCV